MAWKWDQCFASGQTQAGHRVTLFVTPERTKGWTPSAFGILLLTPSLGSHSCQLRVLSSEELLTVLYLTKYPVLWFVRPFLPA